MPLDLDATRWVQRLQKLKASGIKHTFKECHTQLRQALEEIRQGPSRGAADEYNAESVLNEYRARYADEHHGLEHEVISFECSGHTIDLSIFRRVDSGPEGGRPCIYYIHGGGFTSGDRWSGMRTLIPLIHDHNAICVTVEYRLASEWKAPAQLDDCYHGLLEVWKRRVSMGISDRLLVIGRSAGANLACGVTLRVRDSKDDEKPQICGLLLSFPMLDHTSEMASTEFSYSPAWTQEQCIRSWSQYLGDGRETVTIYTVPYTAGVPELVRLPRVRVEIAEVDCLSTEAQYFSYKLREAGNEVVIRVWEGLFHCADGVLQGKQDLYRAEFQSRSEWIRNALRNS